MPSEPKIRLLAADDREIVRRSARVLLADTETMVAVEATTGRAAANPTQEKERSACQPGAIGFKDWPVFRGKFS